jgi:hypothetical protein
MDPQPNPFAVLSLIVAPAILTNASSVLAMSTSNRLARAVDRARELARQIEAAESARPEGDEETSRRLQELAITDERAVILLKVLQSFYIALGGFAMATLLSLIGAVLATTEHDLAVRTLELFAVGAGGIAVAALGRGSVLLVRETNIAVRVMHERAARVRRRVTAR